MLTKVKTFIKSHSNQHTLGKQKSVLVISTPRSGSTWLMELIWSQPGFKYCNEPDNLRNPIVRKLLGIHEWDQLYNHAYTNQIISYFKKINDGTIRNLNPNPFSTFFRFRTNRIVFKILHSMEDQVILLAESCNAIPLLLIRHPLAVSVSREALPRLATFFTKDFSSGIPNTILNEARIIMDKGSFLQKAVVDWCFENYYPVKDVKDNKYKGILYEEMVINPQKSIDMLAPYLNLNDKEVIHSYITKPSKTTAKSDALTKKIITQNYSSEAILNKWKKKVSGKDIIDAQYVLDLFDIDIYKANDGIPTNSFNDII